jgi:hypothetical protein
MVYLARVVTGRDWAARGAVFLFVFTLLAAGAGQPWVDVPVAILFATVVMVALTRFGLWTSAVLLATFTLKVRTPLTLDWSSWYAGRSFAVLGLFAALLTASAYFSLGGKPIFGKALLDD